MERRNIADGPVILIACMLTACGADTPAPITALDRPGGQAPLAAIATSAVVASLEGSNGTGGVDTEWGPQLSAAQATALTTPMARGAGAIANYIRETGSGRPIDIAALEPCGEPMYAGSLYRKPNGATPTYLLNAYGPKWLVTFCTNGVPEVSVSVAASATYLTLSPRGQVQFPAVSGMEFYVRGIPSEWEGGLPVSTTSAMRLAAQATGRKVSRVPELIAPPIDWIPHAVQWSIQLSDEASELGDAPLTGGPSSVLVGMRLDGIPAKGPSSIQVQRLDNSTPGTPPVPFAKSIEWYSATRIIRVGREN